MKYELAVPTFGTEERDAMQRVIDSGMFTMNKEVSTYEASFAAFVGAKHAVMVNSGSSANLLMVASLFYRKDNPLQRGDEVIVPAVSWATTYFPLYQYGLRLRFVDVDPETLNLCPDAVAAAITGRTRLVMAVNLLGNPVDYDRILPLLRERDITLVEDTCEALGGTHRGRQLGTFGLLGSYSTFFSHHMSTMEGGVVVTDSDELYHILLSLRAHGWTRNLPTDNRICTKSSDPFAESFRFILPGYNVRPLELEGAVGCEQLKKLPAMLDMRRRNAVYFQEVFGDSDRFMTQREIGSSSWFGFSLILRDPEENRSSVVETLRKADIGVRPIAAGNFTRQDVVRIFDCAIPDSLPGADLVDRYGFFVGNHPVDIRPQIDYLKRVI